MDGDKEEAVKMWQKAVETGGDVNVEDIVNKIKNGLLLEDEK